MCGRIVGDVSISAPRGAGRSVTPLQNSPHWSGDGVQGGDVPETSGGRGGGCGVEVVRRRVVGAGVGILGGECGRGEWGGKKVVMGVRGGEDR